MTIRAKLILIFLGATGTIALIGGLVAWNYARSLLNTQQAVTSTESILADTYRAQLSFEQQKLAWSYLVLRGQQPVEYYRNLKRFYEYERDTRNALSAIVERLQPGTERYNRVHRFQDVHKMLGQRYREALRMYNKAEDSAFTADRYIWEAVDDPTGELRSIVDLILRSQQTTLEEIYATFGRHQSRVLTISVTLIFLFAAMFYWFLDRTVVRPLSRIAAVAGSVSRGDRSRRVELRSADEFGSLAAGINQMLDSLDATSESLADKISELRREVLQRAAAEYALENRQVELENANSELESFSYSIAHDLRAPLRAITSFSQLLVEDLGDKLTAEQHDMLNRVATAGLRMADLIDHIMHLSRLGRGDLRWDNVNLSELAKQIIADLRAADPERDVAVDIQDDLCVTADPRLAQVILENLLGNAWKYTAHEPHAEIHFGICKSDHSKTVYQVKDNGVGFAMEHADKLFGMFQRLHRHDEFPGDGVGLASVQRAVRRLGGHVWADSTPGGGATFFFTLEEPARPAVTADV